MKKIFLPFLILSVLLSACGVLSGLQLSLPLISHLESGLTDSSNPADSSKLAEETTNNPSVPAPVVVDTGEGVAALEGTLEAIYNQVNPAVVNIQVLSRAEANLNQLPFSFGEPFDNDSREAPLQSGLGSGFVWNKDGYVITNNHVVENAETITVRFADGQMLDAKLIGSDPDSDLAVIQVAADASTLQPVTMGDSSAVRVGQLAIAIGNPFGLEGTMTVGIISALERSLPVANGTITGGTYTIPDIIQTDAPINPGNSGGVLLNAQGQVIGVTTAIQSSGGSSAGVGFVIPSEIVLRIAPELIENGMFQHPWLGISGVTLTPEIAEAAGLPANQRGILVIEVTPGSPADKAGLKGSSKQVEVNANSMLVGGDILTAIDGESLNQFDDLASYLVRKTEAGQAVELQILRNGKEQTLQAELAPRQGSASAKTPDDIVPAKVWLGIQGLDLTSEIAGAMQLQKDQQGVLVVQVIKDSPADLAGLQGSYKPFEVDGQSILIGGDIITALDGSRVTNMKVLQERVANKQAGEEVTLTIIRDGEESSVNVTLAER